MYPILLEFPNLVLYSYGTAIVAAALIAGLLAWRLRPPGLFSANQFLNICLLTTIGAALGARTVGVLLAQPPGSPGFANVFLLWQGAHLSSLGVPVGVVPLLLSYLYHEGLDTGAVFDHLIPFALLAGAVQRCFGCFLAGCCTGKPTDSLLGVLFPGAAHPVHPTQLYLGFSFGVLFMTLFRWRPAVSGLRSLTTLGLFGLVHLVVQPLRAADGSTSGGVSALWVTYALWVFACILASSILLHRAKTLRD